MYELRLMCNQMTKRHDPATGKQISPSFEYATGIATASEG